MVNYTVKFPKDANKTEQSSQHMSDYSAHDYVVFPALRDGYQGKFEVTCKETFQIRRFEITGKSITEIDATGELK